MFGEGTRGRILRGTAEAVAKHGVEGTTVQKVLEASETSRRTFYKYFGNLSDALDGLYDVAVQLVRATVEMAVAGEPIPERKLVRALDAYLDLQEVGGALITTLQAEALRPGSALGARRERLIDELVALFDEVRGSR